MKVLLIEDNLADVDLTQEAITEGFPDIELHIATDGVLGFDKVKEINPNLILLDLNLPKPPGGGLEVLEDLKLDKLLRIIPVVVLTTSNAETDKMKAYQNYANAYLVKPISVEDFSRLVVALGDFWLKANVIA